MIPLHSIPPDQSGTLVSKVSIVSCHSTPYNLLSAFINKVIKYDASSFDSP